MGTPVALPVWAWPELAEAATARRRARRLQLHVHAIGDAAVRAALDAVEHVAAVNGPRDRRPVIAHTQVVHPDDLPRFAALGVVANFEPLWAQRDALHGRPDRAPGSGTSETAGQYPMGLPAARRAPGFVRQRLAGVVLRAAGGDPGGRDADDARRPAAGRLGAGGAAVGRAGADRVHRRGGVPGVRGRARGAGGREPRGRRPARPRRARRPPEAVHEARVLGTWLEGRRPTGPEPSRSFPTIPKRTPTSCGRSRRPATRSTSRAHSCVVQSSSTPSGTQPAPRPRRHRRRENPSSSASWANTGAPRGGGTASTCPRRAGRCTRRAAPLECGARRQRSRAIQASTSSAVRGASAERFSQPSSVTSTSSSIRTPMPRNSSGTSRSSGRSTGPARR